MAQIQSLWQRAEANDSSVSQSWCPVSAGQMEKGHILFQARILLFFQNSDCSKSQVVGKRSIHFSGCEASAGTQTLEVRDSQHAIQGHSWIQFSPSTATKLLSKRKAFSLKQRVKLLLVGKQFLSPLPLRWGLVGFFVVILLFLFFCLNKYSKYSVKDAFSTFQQFAKPRLFQPTPTYTAVISEHGAYQWR